jgi:hypothetical protein
MPILSRTTDADIIRVFVIELRRSAQPFREDYKLYQAWVTHSWMKSVWEKATILHIDIELGALPLLPPCSVNDYWLMVELAKICSTKELIRLNRVRLHQQVIFGSDIMDAGGRCIDKKYLWERLADESWSSMLFPRAIPPKRDFAL